MISAAHWVLETAAFAVGGLLYWRSPGATNQRMDSLTRLGIVAGAALGAALGSRGLYVFQYWSALCTQPWQMWLGGKTLVGALLGGLVGVETAKAALGWHESTGNNFVRPLLVAIVIGRIGCQLSGVSDQTYGNPTTLPWGWNYGDGVPRHPTSLYEILGLGLLAWLVLRPGLAREPGDRFRGFMVGYLLLRFVLEFLKPPFALAAGGTLMPDSWGPFSAIQWACVGGVAYYVPAARRWLRAAAMPAVTGN
jgi:phosphatidylglycerol:prolipoprotein diacylglycerol transferase